MYGVQVSGLLAPDLGVDGTAVWIGPSQHQPSQKPHGVSRKQELHYDDDDDDHGHDEIDDSAVPSSQPFDDDDDSDSNDNGGGNVKR